MANREESHSGRIGYLTLNVYFSLIEEHFKSAAIGRPFLTSYGLSYLRKLLRRAQVNEAECIALVEEIWSSEIDHS